MRATLIFALYQFEPPTFRLLKIRWAFASFSSNFRRNLGFEYVVPSDKIAKSFNPTSIPIEELVFGSSETSTSTPIEMKYFPDGLRLMVAFKIRPLTSRLLAKRTQPSFGNLILFPSIAILLLVYLVV